MLNTSMFFFILFYFSVREKCCEVHYKELHDLYN
jgi:hypothetical protein